MNTGANLKGETAVGFGSQADAAFAQHAYRQMCFIRSLEQHCLDLSQKNPPVIAGSIHLCAGQEAVPVGALGALTPTDKVVTTYRGHGWAIAKGLSPYEILAEIFHKADGVNGGRAGSALMMAPHDGFIGENSIVGAGGPIACGVALADRARKLDGVTVVSFGDGAMNQGALLESFAFAAAYALPVVFICENNGWSEMTQTSSIVKTDRLAKRANGFGLSAATIDGGDPIAVRETIRLAAQRARNGEGPSLIECRVVRLWGHYNRDIEHYRPKKDRELAQANDPIELLRRRLVNSGVSTDEQLERTRSEVEMEIDQLVERVLAAPTPHASTGMDHVTASSLPADNAPNASPETQEVTYIQAVNEALRRELAQRPDVLVYGEDVGHAGGIFAASRNLQRDFGAERVFDTPISEAAILGSAVGAAMNGARPIVEIMWADFLLVALDQLINQAANVRYITQGKVNVPLLVRTQQGATPGSCAQHSQCLEALLAHIPGLRVGLPATPQDAYDMLRAAAAHPDPVVIIEARALYQQKGRVAYDDTVEPVGGAKLRRDGRDLAIITWGTSVGSSLEAAEKLAQRGIQAAVLDLRWLSPIDQDAIDDVASRCNGRVLIVHEANVTGGVGAEVAARVAERVPGARVRRLGAPDVRIPASPVLQAALIPGAGGIFEAGMALAQKLEHQA